MNSLCGSDPWGPFSNGSLTLCFIDCVFVPILFVWILVGSLFRIRVLVSVPEAEAVASRLYVFKLVCTWACVLLPLLHMFVGLVFSLLAAANAIAEGVTALSWLIFLLVLLLERSRAKNHDFVSRVWLMCMFASAAFKIKATYVSQHDSTGHTIALAVFVASFIPAACLAVLGVFYNDDEQPADYGALPTNSRADMNTSVDSFELNQEPVEHESAFTRANLLSKLFFSWLSPVLVTGSQRPLMHDDLPHLSRANKSRPNSEKFEQYWSTATRDGSGMSLLRPLLKSFGALFAVAALPKFVSDLCQFVGPIVLTRIVRVVTQSQDPLYEGSQSQLLLVGLFFVAVLFGGSALATLCIHTYFYILTEVAVRLRAALVAAIYRKSFTLSNDARQKQSLGEMVNYMGVDTQKLVEPLTYLHMIWSAPVQIIISLVLLWIQLGYSVLGGVLVMILLIPTNTKVASWMAALQKEMLKAKDARTKAVNEMLQGIRIIKYFAWEESFTAKIMALRLNEIKALTKGMYYRALTLFLWTGSPVLVSLVTFTIYSLTGHELTASKVFTSLSLFNILRFPLNMLPQVVNSLVESRVSLRRIAEFLAESELDPGVVTRAENRGEIAVRVTNADLAWSVSAAGSSLTNINVSVKRGSLVAIVGAVGSGKSSLLSALLGDMVPRQGTITLDGRVAYCQQQAWLRNASLRNNVLFGKPWSSQRYQEAVEVCQLASDIRILPAGDQTEIGEKGINLSGGQKQRVSLARAVYQDADIYLLDDPLSAVDAHVGRAIFERCLCGKLANKTRILVTHQLQFLDVADYIYVMDKGTIVESGTYGELMASRGLFARLWNEHISEQKAKSKELPEADSAAPAASSASSSASAPSADAPAAVSDSQPTLLTPPPKLQKKDAGPVAGKKLIAAEERDTGAVSSDVYAGYVVAIGGGFVAAAVLLLYVLETVCRTGGDYWLSVWSSALADQQATESGSGKKDGHLLFYLGIYVLWALAFTVMVFVRALALAYVSLRASRKLHDNMLACILRAPMSFFDTTPLGRILNRFSKDQQSVDENLPRSLGMFLSTVFGAIGSICIISLVTPFFLVFGMPMAWLYRSIQDYYRSSSRELQRLDSISKSPIYAHFEETLNGASTIRAYQLQQMYTVESEQKVDHNQRAYWCYNTSNRWLGVRLEFVGNAVVTCAALFIVLERSSIDPSMAGLSIAYALTITATLQWLVRMSSDAETQLVAVERLAQYTKIPSEAPSEIEATRPPESWPNAGAIELRNVQLRYREGLDLVLRGISVSIRAREKIGVVGRTGAGKSSLMLALFRLVELASGSITIDGVDISTIGLRSLRSKLAIIPQDPVLFQGTLRSNLDPFSEYADDAVWAALESCGLRDFVDGTEHKLLHPTTEGGENLSVGQRQLLCLARALLRPSRVLVLDEASAAVDFDTDSKIQKTIRTGFADRTVLTIAHRINTIIDYDRILVLGEGRVLEFDTPQNLLNNSSSVFAGMAKAGH